MTPEDSFKLILGFFGLCAAIAIIALAGLFIIPVAVIGGIAWGIYHWTHKPPVPPTTAELHQQTHVVLFPEEDEFVKHIAYRSVEQWAGDCPLPSIIDEFLEITGVLYRDEGFLNMPLLTDFRNQLEEARYRDQLIAHKRKVSSDPARTLDLFKATLFASFNGLHGHLPAFCRKDGLDMNAPPPAFGVPLRTVIPDLGRAIEDLSFPFRWEEVKEAGLFAKLRKQLEANQARVDGGKAYIPASIYPNVQGDIVRAYLGGTGLEDVFYATVPFELGEQRFSGMWVIAPPGRGKTTLLHGLLVEDFKRDASIIVMDSKGDLIDPIKNLKELEDRYVLIEPDAENPIAINPLDIPQTDITHAVDLLEYLFGSLLEFKMTALQSTLFRSVLRALVTAFPNPTLDTFRDVLTNGWEKYAEQIKKLPPELQEFFYKEFNERMYADRRREVVQRLRLLLDNPSMAAMLLSLQTRFDIGRAMDDGKVVIINNSKALLGDTGSEFFGRFFIAQVLAAAQQRSGRKQGEKKPVYFYIDECQSVIARDDKIPTILDECRSQRIALIMAHQRTAQITSSNVLDALSNCAVRYANSDDEARWLAPRLRSTENFLQTLKVGQFAAYVRDMTPRALALTVTPVDFSAIPKLSAAEETELRDRMQALYGTPREIAPESVAIGGSDHSEPQKELVPAEPTLKMQHVDTPSQREDMPIADATRAAAEPPPPDPPSRGGRVNKPGDATEGAAEWL